MWASRSSLKKIGRQSRSHFVENTLLGYLHSPAYGMLRVFIFPLITYGIVIDEAVESQHPQNPNARF